MCMQVFFVRDGMKFPDMVHALKPNPMTHEQVRACLQSVSAPSASPRLMCTRTSAHYWSGPRIALRTVDLQVW